MGKVITRYKLTIEGRELGSSCLSLLDKLVKEEHVKFENTKVIAYSWFFQNVRHAVAAMLAMYEAGQTNAYLTLTQEQRN